MGNPEGLCSAPDPWEVRLLGQQDGLRVLLSAVSPFHVLLSFERKWNPGEHWEGYTWNVVSSYWFALVPDPFVKAFVLFLDFLLVFGVGALDADNRRRLFLWIQHCSQAVPSIFLSRDSFKLLFLIKILFTSNSLFGWSCSGVREVSRRILFFFFSRKEVKATRLKRFNRRF